MVNRSVKRQTLYNHLHVGQLLQHLVAHLPLVFIQNLDGLRPQLLLDLGVGSQLQQQERQGRGSGLEPAQEDDEGVC